MTQLGLKLKNPRRIDVDGLVDEHGIVFVGDAVEQFDGTFVAAADVGGSLCLVEANFKYNKESGS